MLLDELVALIETLRVRIGEHGQALSQSEALTRYALIDPLLRGLGWDTGDPAQVIPEYPVSSAGKGVTFADYALLNREGQPVIVVEAKSLQSDLKPAAVQALGYCSENGFPHFAVTDGRHWRLYETFRAVPLEQRLIVELDMQQSAAQTALAALALWRPSASESMVHTASAPVIAHQPDRAPAIPSLPPPSQPMEMAGTPSQTSSQEQERSHQESCLLMDNP